MTHWMAPWAQWQKLSSWYNINFLILSIGSCSCGQLQSLRKKNYIMQLSISGLQSADLPYTSDFITASVCASRIWHGVPMVPVSIHFKNLGTSKKKNISLSIITKYKMHLLQAKTHHPSNSHLSLSRKGM